MKFQWIIFDKNNLNFLYEFCTFVKFQAFIFNKNSFYFYLSIFRLLKKNLPSNNYPMNKNSHKKIGVKFKAE